MAIWIMIICIVIAVWAIFPPGPGKMPLFYDNNGKILPDSISEKTYIDVDGAKIGLLITGKSRSNPVLLFLGGGPGIPEYLLEYQIPQNWLIYLLCVTWTIVVHPFLIILISMLIP